MRYNIFNNVLIILLGLKNTGGGESVALRRGEPFDPALPRASPLAAVLVRGDAASLERLCDVGGLAPEPRGRRGLNTH